MPISTNRRGMTGGNFGSPKIDLGGCVFYAPLWRPDLAGSPFNSSGVYGIPIHSCTVAGALWTSQGRSFDGDDYVDVGTPANLNFTSQNFSGEAWVKFTAITSNHGIFGKGSYQTIGWEFFVNILGQLSLATYQNLANQNSTSDVGTIVINTWYHLAFVRNGASVRLYRNGVDITNTAANHVDPADNSAQKMIVGAGYDGGALWLKGTIGEGLIYNRALPASEITQNYLATKWRYT